MEKTTKELFTELIKKYGEDNELETFNYCSDYGIELDGSTIDKIDVDFNTIRFFYNENEGDFDYIEDFDDNDLIVFYNELLNVIAEEAIKIENSCLINEMLDWAKQLQKEYDDADNNGCLFKFADRAKDFIDTFIEKGEEL